MIKRIKKLNRVAAAFLSLCLILLLLPGQVSAAATVNITFPFAVLVQGDVPDAPENFTFVLAGTGVAPMPAAGDQITVTGSGNGAFSIDFDRVGDYTYTLTQLVGSATGYYYDNKVYTIKAHVTNAAGGGLAYTITFEDNGSKATAITFTNTYYKALPPAQEVGTLTLSKTVTGGLGDKYRDFAFHVSLRDSAGAALTGSYPYSGVGVPGGMIHDGDTVSLKDAQSIVIRNLPVGAVYSVTEVQANQDGYSTFSVGAIGTITAQGNTSAWTNFKAGPVDPSPVTVFLDPQKTLDGVAPQGSEFTFYLKDENGSVLQTKKNHGGAIAFDALSFTQEGVYTYFMSEHAGSDSKILYDGAVYTVKITVTRQGSALVATDTTILKDGQPFNGQVPVFENKTKQGGGTTDSEMYVLLSKVWDDDGDKAAARPQNVTVTLLRNGETYRTLSISAQNGWQTRVTLPVVGNYTVVESPVSGYESTISGNTTDGFVITNRYTNDTPVTPPGPVEPQPSDPGNPGEPDKPKPSDKPEGGSAEKDDVPQTSDTTRNSLWRAAAGISAAGMLLLLLTRKKRETQETTVSGGQDNQ